MYGVIITMQQCPDFLRFKHVVTVVRSLSTLSEFRTDNTYNSTSGAY